MRSVLGLGLMLDSSFWFLKTETVDWLSKRIHVFGMMLCPVAAWAQWLPGQRRTHSGNRVCLRPAVASGGPLARRWGRRLHSAHMCCNCSTLHVHVWRRRCQVWLRRSVGKTHHSRHRRRCGLAWAGVAVRGLFCSLAEGCTRLWSWEGSGFGCA
jgi:hypothetical protein